MAIMTAQLPLTLVPAGAIEIGRVAALVEDAAGGRVFVRGELVFAWDAGDDLGRRLAAVQLVRIKGARAVRVEEHPETLGLAWGRLLDRAEVRHLRLHDARHTCGTLMHLRGVPVAVIAAWLGHTDAAFTMRTYVHSQDDALRSAAS